MADKNDEKDVNEKEEEPVEGAEVEGKKAVPSGLILGLLKWVAIVIGAIILIVTVVIVTMRIIGGNSAGQPAIPLSQVYAGRQEALGWYQAIGAIRTRTSDAIPASINVDTVFGYTLDDKQAPAELTSRQVEIKDFLRRYFTEKTKDDLLPRNEEKLQIEIRNAINDEILTTSKIRAVRFLTLDVMD
jgi:flagellar FliL protein